MPSGNHWKLRGIPPTLKTHEGESAIFHRFGQGLLEDDLRRVIGYSGAIFCLKNALFRSGNQR